MRVRPVQILFVASFNVMRAPIPSQVPARPQRYHDADPGERHACRGENVRPLCRTAAEKADVAKVDEQQDVAQNLQSGNARPPGSSLPIIMDTSHLSGGIIEAGMNRFPALFSSLLVASALLGQQPAAPPENSDTVIRSNVREVLLDVVVRQKNEQLARKLKASDFTITEDGVPQTIKTFRLVKGTDTEPQPAPLPTAYARQTRQSAPASPPVQKLEDPAFVSIVFEELSPLSRKYARDAAIEFLKHELNSNTYVAIFSMNNGLYRLQNFTSNRTLLSSAVERASLSSYSSLTVDNSKVENTLDYQVTTGTGGVSVTSIIAAATTPDLATGDASTNPSDPAAVIQSQQRDIAMYMGGMRTVDGLLNLVKYESQLPGRKTILYVCEGLNLPPGQRERIYNVISNANRANVSFYGIDARGLTTFSPNALARNMSKSVAATSATQMYSSMTGVTQAMMKQDDEFVELGVANTQINLQELSERTGGFVTMETNEIGKAMVRVMEDVRTHYEITYTPASDVYDGHFRKIEVKTANPKLAVQSRDGYYALPDLNGHALEPFEMPALAALNAKAAPAFPVRVAALRFDPSHASVRYEIAFELAGENITSKIEPNTHLPEIHASFLALIRDSRGQVIEKVSRDIDRLVPKDKLDLFRRGKIIFTTPVSLAPGHYTVDAVALDPEGNRSAIRRIALSVAPPESVAVSDVALVHDFQPLTAPRDTTDPLQFDGGRVTPQLDQKSRAADATSLYFVLYPASGDHPQVTVDFFRDGAAIAETHPHLDKADAVNSIPVVASAKLPPGDYQARVTVEQSGRAVRRWTAFTVAP
jgi:VWFA-related protein